MKKTLKLVPALAMLLISAILVSTSTYAWFSMNNTVTVTGMTVKTVVSDNLLIADSSMAQDAKESEDSFINTLTQEVKGILEPVSAADGKTFFYTNTNNVKADGDAITETYLAYASNIAEKEKVHEDPDDNSSPLVDAPYFNNFSENYGVSRTVANSRISGENKAVGYVDYVFQLKALNTDASNPAYINLTKLNLKYNGTDASDESKAYRVAVFAEKFGATTANKFSAAPGTLKAIYTLAGAQNFTIENSKNQALVGTSGTMFGDVVYADDAVAVATVTAGQTEYWKVVVRLWIEGEDTTCNNETYMSLTNAWTLDLELKLQSTEDGVANING